VALAEVVGVFGVSGEVRLHLFNRDSRWFSRWRKVVLLGPDGRRHAARVKAREGAGDRVIGTIDGVVGRDAARSWMGGMIAVERARLPALADDEAYVWQLVGLTLRSSSGVVLGRVTEVHTHCPTPIVEYLPAGAAEASFVPLVPGEVTVDIPGGVIVVPDALVEGPP
jgi:ribosomal 30S subunit maturation factor RimM